MTRPSIDRRSFLQGTGAAALLAAGSSLTAGCGSTSNEQQKAAAEANRTVRLPTYTEYTGVEPDLPGTPGGIRPGFLTYPSEPPEVSTERPGSGGTFRVMAVLYDPLPPGVSQNHYWQALHERLGAELEIIMVQDGEYDQKFATMTAGDDLPDFVNVRRPPHLPELLEAKFADLTEFLSGDAIEEYPNLANIPERSWRPCIHNGGIYGIPVPRDAVGGMPFVRADILKRLGLSTRPENFEEFREIARAVSDPRETRWAFALADYPLWMIQTMLHAPNGWRNDGGKLTATLETDEHRRAVELVRQFWAEGLIHPDAYSPTAPFKQWFNAGDVVIQNDSYQAWRGYIKDNTANPEFELGLMVLPGFDGGEGRISLGGATFFDGLTALKKAGKARLREQLRIADWLAAPFGTAEYFFRLYGQEGLHHTLDDDGNPVLTAVGRSETVIPIRYVTEGPQVIYEPGRPNDVRVQHEYESEVIPKGIPNPCLGLYSSTATIDGPTIDTALADLRSEVIRGRMTMADYDEGIATWRTEGGDQIRREFEEQIQEYGANED